MTLRMKRALWEHVHLNVHESVQTIGDDISSSGEQSAVVSLESLMGPTALMMFYDGLRFALDHPAAARAYAEMLAEVARTPDLQEADRLAFQALEAAWRPLQ